MPYGVLASFNDISKLKDIKVMQNSTKLLRCY